MNYQIGDVIEVRVFGVTGFVRATIAGPVNAKGGFIVKLEDGSRCYAHARDVKPRESARQWVKSAEALPSFILRRTPRPASAEPAQ